MANREGIYQSSILQSEVTHSQSKNNSKTRVNNRSTNLAYDVRETFKVYFNSELGAIPQQYTNT
ncbi:hypothetical protein NQ314_017712 [Rhamnusium bicolor]|uniref:Uncharacterized protein n=1 Tax=Rhamnusium bicolor TaxID=1586634 RepID=A0AAV8WS43_9CUCU|nr:hypothetical protein NQ314_017712 [Rhamnusium bicolor]